MFKKVHLAFFGKHEDLTVNFTPGLNVIRAANESGKSTGLKAIAYALFGTKALKESLEETVTYDHKETELKVTLEFTVNGIDYTIRRGKTGCECTYAAQRVTGQTEVTKFVESLLGATADTSAKLMLAKQSSVAGALSEGPSGPVKLIETLADFDLITTLVDLVQNKLPSGNTRLVEDQILKLSEASLEVIEDTTPAVRLLIAEVVQAYGAQEVVVEVAKAELEEPSVFIKQIADATNVIKRTEALQQQMTGMAVAMANCVIPASGNDNQIAYYTERIQQGKERKEAWRLRQELVDLGSVAYAFKTEEEHVAQVADNAKLLVTLRQKHHQLELDFANANSRLITESACGLCGKDLTDVPEVAAKNQEAITAIGKAKSLQASTQLELEAALEEQQRLAVITRDHARCALVYARAAKYIKVKPSTTPAGYEWIGPPPSDGLPEPDYTALLQKEHSAKIAHAAKVAELAQLTKQQAALTAELAALPEIDARTVEQLELRKVAAEASQERFRQELVRLQALRAEVKAVEATLAQELAVMAEAQKRVDRAKVQLAEAVANLAEQNSNNVLISKMRAARPRIADRLWSIVLSSVSGYFSSVRGEVSVVTRTDNGFRVNDRPASGLSGSTQDALGLAIRIALTKTFLPNARFMILDEVAAGMDDNREAALLGLISSCGMEQVILVTHSPLADSFSNNVITL